MTPQQKEAHDALLGVALGHTKLTGVEPPSAEDAAAGTMQEDGPDGFKLQEEPEPPQSVSVTSVSAPSVGAPPRRPPADTSKPLGFSMDDTAMRDAQSADAKSKAMGKLGQSVSAFAERPTNFADYAIGLGGGGKSAAPARSTLWDEQAADGDKAVSGLMARRKSESEMEAKRGAAAKAAEAKDPNSETAKLYRSVLLKYAPDLAEKLQGATAEQMERMQPWLSDYAAKNGAAIKATEAKAEADRKAKLHDTERGQDLQNRKDNHADSQAIAESNNAIARASLGIRAGADQRDQVKDAREAAEKTRGHTLSPTAVTDLADAETAIKELGNLGKTFDELEMSGPMARASGVATEALGLSGTDAAKYQAAALRGMQGVGKIMEGGKLAAGDETKYRRMLPIAGDSPELKRQKIEESQRFLRSLVDERIKALKGAHYDVSGVAGAEDAGEIHTAPNGKKLRVFKDGTSEVVE